MLRFGVVYSPTLKFVRIEILSPLPPPPDRLYRMRIARQSLPVERFAANDVIVMQPADWPVVAYMTSRGQTGGVVGRIYSQRTSYNSL
jgi:hypothetical protein